MYLEMPDELNKIVSPSFSPVSVAHWPRDPCVGSCHSVSTEHRQTAYYGPEFDGQLMPTGLSTHQGTLGSRSGSIVENWEVTLNCTKGLLLGFITRESGWHRCHCIYGFAEMEA
jgi:hypothetical protein